MSVQSDYLVVACLQEGGWLVNELSVIGFVQTSAIFSCNTKWSRYFISAARAYPILDRFHNISDKHACMQKIQNIVTYPVIKADRHKPEDDVP